MTREPTTISVEDRRANAVAFATGCFVNLAIQPAYIPWIWSDVQRPMLDQLGMVAVGLPIFIAVMAVCVVANLLGLAVAIIIAFQPRLTVRQVLRGPRRKPNNPTS